MSAEEDEATVLMNAAAMGDASAADRLLPLVYGQLRRAAQSQLALEPSGHTLCATEMVHEAYLRLVGPRQVPWGGRAHFYAAAAQAMRRILVDHARSRASRRAGGQRSARLEDLGDVAALASATPDQILAVDGEVTRLEADDPDAAAVVRLRFYAGLTVEQTGEALGLSPRTVARLWAYARAVLYRGMVERRGNEGPPDWERPRGGR